VLMAGWRRPLFFGVCDFRDCYERKTAEKTFTLTGCVV